jgi:carbon monoxide dehydrogenase subunit G
MMDMSGERRIPAPRQKVWEALNDPNVLKASIPGCESLEKLSDSEMAAVAAVRIGPIAARFNGRVQLTDLDPPNAYRISGEGQGGVAGFAKGGANVRLTEDAGATLLTYGVQAQVGGKIAQLGARLIDASAKQMADQFFDRFSAQLTQGETQAPAAPLAGETSPPPPQVTTPPRPASISVFSLIPSAPYGMPLVAWIGGVIWLLIFIMIFSAYL